MLETSEAALFCRSNSMQDLTVAKRPAFNLLIRVSAFDIFFKLFCLDHRRFPESLAYNHGSAQDTDAISQFICDTFVNSCRVDQTARTTCASAAQAAVVKQAAMTSAQADAFDAVFGIKRDIAANTPPGDESQGNQDTGTRSNHPGPANFGK